jgi:membrane-bound serine protease (ClpP class)
VLKTANAGVVEIALSPREKVFQVLWRPEVLFLLMLIAIYGIIGELSNPGAVLPGVVGAIALILMLYMSAVLPVNIAGMALVVLAIALFVVDVFAPTHGVLTFGGAVAFFLGALMMFDRAEPMLRLSLKLIVPAMVITTAFFVFVVGKGLSAQRLPRRAGVESLLGQTACALCSIDETSGKLFVDGEYWNATSEEPVQKNAKVEILAVEGLSLRVKPQASVTTGQEGDSS